MNLKSRLVSEDLIQIQKELYITYALPKKLTLRNISFVACSRNPGRLVCKFGLVSCKDWSNLIWSLFSENGTAADAFYWSANLQSCITTGIEIILMCRRECFHNWIKEDSNLDLTGFKTHKNVVFSMLHILLWHSKCYADRRAWLTILLQNDIQNKISWIAVLLYSSPCSILQRELAIFTPQELQLQH